MCCAAELVAHLSVMVASRGGERGSGKVGDEPLLAGKCYLKVRVTHTSRLMAGVVFSHRLYCERAGRRDL